VKFTVTPLGGGRADTARVVDSIVRYLQPHPTPSPTPSTTAPGRSGPERYYADSSEEPGRWLGRTASRMGLTGTVEREHFAAVLAGRDPYTDERLITAQGSAGRRPTLGSGAHTRLGDDGERLYGVADAAAALGVSHRELERMCDAGIGLAVTNLVTPQSTEAAAGPPPGGRPGGLGQDRGPRRPPVRPPVGPPAGPPAGAVTSPFNRLGGSHLLPIVETDGSRLRSVSSSRSRPGSTTGPRFA